METNNTQSPAPAETQSPQPETPSLEQIASELSVTEQAQQFTANVPPPSYQQPAQQPFRAPDPISDPEGYNRYMATQTQTLSSLDQMLRTVDERVKAFERQQVEQKVNSDVEKAVAVVNEKLKLEPKLVEVALEYIYRTDQNFKKIWDNRDRNPQAYKKALEVVTEKTLLPMFNVKQDPRIAENIRAARTSQQSMATTNRPGVNEGVPTDPAEFQRYWSRLVSGGQ